MTLYFIRSNGEKRLVKKNVEPKTALSEISHYVNNLNPAYKIYYTREWYDEEAGGTMYDVGSHTEFFLLVDEN
jgi:hypothetical protein